MELKIYSPTEDGFIKAIEWNHEEIKKEVAEKVSYYSSLVYTDDQIKDAKADRAKLNKFVQALESKRKDIKKQCLAPYDDFEKEMNEIIAIVNEPIRMIDNQVKCYEDQKKAEKLDKIKEYWNQKEKPFAIEFERIMDARWLNSSTSMKSIQSSIDNMIDCINKDLDTLQNLPEFGFEATEVYKSTLDINKAIQEGHRLSDIQKRKQEHEAEQERKNAEAEEAMKEAICKFSESAKQTAMAISEAEFAKHMNPPVEGLPIEPLKQWVSFKALLTVEDATALKSFFNSRNIEFEAI